MKNKFITLFIPVIVLCAFVMPTTVQTAEAEEEVNVQEIFDFLSLIGLSPSVSSANDFLRGPFTIVDNNICGAFYIGRNLSIGSTGLDVTRLQTYLTTNTYNGTPFLTMPAGVSMGYYGNLTASAVSRLQQSLGLDVTGVISCDANDVFVSIATFFSQSDFVTVDFDSSEVKQIANGSGGVDELEFEIDFTIEAKDKELYIPANFSSNVSNGLGVNALGYAIIDDQNKEAIGGTQVVSTYTLESDAEKVTVGNLQTRSYVIEPNSSEDFTLKLNVTSSVQPKEYHLELLVLNYLYKTTANNAAYRSYFIPGKFITDSGTISSSAVEPETNYSDIDIDVDYRGYKGNNVKTKPLFNVTSTGVDYSPAKWEISFDCPSNVTIIAENGSLADVCSRTIVRDENDGNIDDMTVWVDNGNSSNVDIDITFKLYNKENTSVVYTKTASLSAPVTYNAPSVNDIDINFSGSQNSNQTYSYNITSEGVDNNSALWEVTFGCPANVKITAERGSVVDVCSRTFTHIDGGDLKTLKSTIRNSSGSEANISVTLELFVNGIADDSVYKKTFNITAPAVTN